jgi:hypothetical protein
MPDEITPDASAVALATITEQIRGLVEGMARSERQLEKLDPINTALGEMRVSLALKADTSALNMVDQKVINWIALHRCGANGAYRRRCVHRDSLAVARNEHSRYRRASRFD